MRRTQLTRDNVTMLWTYQIWGGCFAIIRSSNFTMVKLCKSSSSRTGLNESKNLPLLFFYRRNQYRMIPGTVLYIVIVPGIER